MMINPIGPRVVVEPIEKKEELQGGIYIPETTKEGNLRGKVVAVGKKLDDDGKEVAFDVKLDDVVLLPKYGSTEVEIDGRKLLVVKEEDILAVFAE